MSEQRMQVNLAEGSVSFCCSPEAAEMQASMERMWAIAHTKASGTSLPAKQPWNISMWTKSFVVPIFGQIPMPLKFS